MNTNETMLGCPFCGEQPEYQPATKDPNNPPYSWPHTIVHNCKVVGRQLCIRCDYSDCEDTEEAVRKVWNTRAAVASLADNPADKPEARCTLEHLWAYLNFQYPATVGDVRLRVLCGHIATLPPERAAFMEDLKWRAQHDALTLVKDGDKWCAVGIDFCNLQESPAGFGATADEAIANYRVSFSQHLEAARARRNAPGGAPGNNALDVGI